MPRAETKPLSPAASTQFYHSSFTNNANYLPESSPPSPTTSQANSPSPSIASSAAPPTQKKKHVCQTCDRAFTTSGHLARHSRVHTGERNHKCPFPGCETRCSRQDNLQQHYRIHLSPGSRRSSTRSAISRAMNPSKRGTTASSSATDASQSPAPPPLSSPPALEPARYAHHSPPPDSPPPLAQATLPATAHMHHGHHHHQDHSAPSSRSSSSPDINYSNGGSMGQSMVPQLSQSQQYSYRSGTTTYQEQSQGAGAGGFTYVHTTPISHSSGNTPPSSATSSFSGSYSSPHHSHHHHQQQQHHHHEGGYRDVSPVSISSRHSISHISHPQQRHHHHHSGPPSPASSHSVSSHTSGPPTPASYPPVFHEEHHPSYHNAHGMTTSSSHHQQQMGPATYGNARFDSPPPTLAPIQDERLIRRDVERGHGGGSPHIYQPQPMPEYQYHSGLGHGAWKTEGGLRKGVGALVQ